MLKEAINNILDELRYQNNHQTDAMWDASDIGRYVKLSKSSVQTKLLCKANFPRAIRLPTTEDGGGRRWYAREVKEWVKRHREMVK